MIYSDGESIYRRSIVNDDDYCHEVSYLRDVGSTRPCFDRSDYKVLAVIPPEIYFHWIRASGLDPSDPAARDVVLRNALSPDYEAFRVWRGNP